MAELFANDAYTTLNGAINNSVTSLVVNDGALFPTDGDFRIRVDDEFMLVTAVSGTTWTVVRAVEGMGVAPTGTAASHSNAAEVRQVLTRDALMGGLGGGGSSTFLIPELLLPEDDNFTETAMDAKWTRVKSSTTKGTWGVGSGLLSYHHNLANAGSELDVWVQSDTISIGDYVQAGFVFQPNAQWHGPWIGFSDGATYGSGAVVGSFIHWSGTYRWMLNSYPGFQNRATDGSIVDSGTFNTPMHLRVKYEAANTWGLYLSPNGRNWHTIQTNYSLTLTPTHLNLGVHFLNPALSGLSIVNLLYFRKNAVST